MHEQKPDELCRRFGEILQAEEVKQKNGVCVATKSREGLNVSILGRPVKSEVVKEISLSYEDLDAQGRALCVGELFFTEAEVTRFLNAVANRGIIVSAVHNHWLFDLPRLMYTHVEAIMEPLSFATIIQYAFTFATKKS